MSAPLNHEIAGWFGKIPALGDFATRRLPASFIASWDEWLSTELREAQRLLAGAWDERYDRAPVTCFSLGEDTLDAQRWHGILVPSADRVGRRFPLTIACTTEGTLSAPGTPWWSAVIAVGCFAANPGAGVAEFEARLMHLPRHDAGTCIAANVVPAPGTSAWRRYFPGSTGGTPFLAQGLPRGVAFRALLQLV
jgi:type VI secretion system protein ImpM